MVDEITAGLITSVVRLMVAVFVSYSFFKSRSPPAMYLGLFFILFGIHGWFRTLSLMTGNEILFFLHRLAMIFPTVIILQVISQSVSWISRYKIVFAIAAVSIILSYVDAFVFGGFVGEARTLWATIPSFSFSAVGMLMTAYFFNAQKGMPRLGRNIMAVGFMLQSVLLFAAFLIVRNNLAGVGFYLGLVFTSIIAVGWWMVREKLDMMS
ncbi:MAG: hypothetical protein HYT11_04055 [Candidatus Levybacteria bacterium]|nr:hypothetical protein [Candidatus Levybacteria bacterium]